VAARPHGDLIKVWLGRDLTGAMFSETAHGTDENYLTGVTNAGAPFAIDLSDGTDCTVTISDPTTYLAAGSASSKDKLRTQVVDDFTFIGNRSVVVAMASTTSTPKVNEALVFVRATAFDCTYKITLSGPGSASATVTTDPSTVTGTSSIASDLRTALNGVDGYSCFQHGSTLRIARADGAAFTVDASDDGGDANMPVFNGSASSFDKLPARGFSNMVVKVGSDDGNVASQFYMKFVGDPSTGAWQETVGPGITTDLDAATMPHALVSTGFRTFEFKRLAWSSRIAGDDDTAKVPSFVGKSIQDMIYHQRRLGFIWSAGVVFSKTDFPFTIFPDTVQTVLATAPVDIKVSSGDKRGASVLDFGLQVQENLYLWAQRSQFRVSSGQDPFRQDTVEVLPSMAYQYAPAAYPLPVANFVFLATDAGTFASLRALLYSQTRLSGDTDVTSHVGQYIAAGVTDLTASDTLRYVFVQSDGDQDVLYLFNYTYDGDQGFIQTAINTWRIPGGQILWCGLKDNSLRLFQQRPEGVVFLKFDLTPQAKDPIAGATYNTRLDFRVSETGVTGLAYDADAKTTSFKLPYKPTGPDLIVATSADKTGGYTRGRIFEIVSQANVSDGQVVTVKGDLTGYQFYAGQRITAERTESEFFVRGQQGAMPVDELTVNRFFLWVAATGYTRVEVSAPNKATKKYEFTGQVLGGIGAHTGTPTPSNGHVNAPIADKSKNATIRLVNDSFLPSYWQAAAYDYTAVGWSAPS
jgi:hypothetical protein